MRGEWDSKFAQQCVLAIQIRKQRSTFHVGYFSQISVLVATAIVKSHSLIFGNIACTVSAARDAASAYGADPGHRAMREITAVSGDRTGGLQHCSARRITAAD
jgi:hypothetical protein